MEHKDKVKGHFNKWAQNYDKSHITEWFRAMQLKTIEMINPQSSDHVLDVGCGTGWAVISLGKKLSRGHAYGIDIASTMIEQAKNNAGGEERVEFKLGDSENIPYEDSKFDAIMCTSSFHHYPDPVGALGEFLRVLKPGRRIYILDTCRDGLFWPFVSLYDLGHRLIFQDHVRYYHSREIKQFLQEVGFSNIRVEYKVQKFFYNKKILTSVFIISGEKLQKNNA